VHDQSYLIFIVALYTITQIASKKSPNSKYSTKIHEIL